MISCNINCTLYGINKNLCKIFRHNNLGRYTLQSNYPIQSSSHIRNESNFQKILRKSKFQFYLLMNMYGYLNKEVSLKSI